MQRTWTSSATKLDVAHCVLRRKANSTTAFQHVPPEPCLLSETFSTFRLIARRICLKTMRSNLTVADMIRPFECALTITDGWYIPKWFISRNRIIAGARNGRLRDGGEPL